MMIFLDETGTDRRDTLRKKGYSLRGKPAKKQQLLIRGEHVTVISYLSVEGILGCHTVRGGVNSDVFYSITLKHLVPLLMPFNGINKNSIVIMDNCSIHHTQEVVSTIEDTGIILHFCLLIHLTLTPLRRHFQRLKL